MSFQVISISKKIDFKKKKTMSGAKQKTSGYILIDGFYQKEG